MKRLAIGNTGPSGRQGHDQRELSPKVRLVEAAKHAGRRGREAVGQDVLVPVGWVGVLGQAAAAIGYRDSGLNGQRVAVRQARQMKAPADR